MSLIVNLCPTGMIPTKDMTHHVPTTPEEIIETSVACANMGARIVHIHPRDENGKPTWKKEIFAQIIGGIREKTDKLLISATTSGRYWSEFDKRSECLELEGDLKPDLASLTLGSNNFIHTASVNAPDMIQDLAKKMKDRGIKPELEVFEPGMANTANYLISKGILEADKSYFNILLGSLGTSPLDANVLGCFLSQLPRDAVWSLAGIGRYQLRANVMALAMGGHIRIGLEDNIFYKPGLLASNQDLLGRILRIAWFMGVDIATPKQTREMLGL